MKKKGIIIWSLLAIVWIWAGFWYMNNNWNFIKGWEKGCKEISLNWKLELNIPWEWKINTDFSTKFAYAYKNKWLEERLKVDTFKIKSVKWKDTIAVEMNWLDLIQKEYKKYGHIDNIKLVWKNADKEQKKLERMLSYFKNNTYLLADEKVLEQSDNIKTMFKNPVVKDLILWQFTPNPLEYFKQHKVFDNLNNLIYSEKLLLALLDKEWDKYKLNKNICTYTYWFFEFL